MEPPNIEQRGGLPSAVKALLIAESATFLLAAGLHAGLRIPLGATILSEPSIPPATIVEGAIAVALGVAGIGAAGNQRWAHPAAIGATGFGIAGVLLGITALAVGLGPATTLNTWYHRVMLALLSLGFFYLLSRGGNVTLGSGARPEEQAAARG